MLADPFLWSNMKWGTQIPEASAGEDFVECPKSMTYWETGKLKRLTLLAILATFIDCLGYWSTEARYRRVDHGIQRLPNLFKNVAGSLHALTSISTVRLPSLPEFEKCMSVPVIYQKRRLSARKVSWKGTRALGLCGYLTSSQTEVSY